MPKHFDGKDLTPGHIAHPYHNSKSYTSDKVRGTRKDLTPDHKFSGEGDKKGTPNNSRSGDAEWTKNLSQGQIQEVQKSLSLFEEIKSIDQNIDLSKTNEKLYNILDKWREKYFQGLNHPDIQNIQKKIGAIPLDKDKKEITSILEGLLEKVKKEKFQKVVDAIANIQDNIDQCEKCSIFLLGLSDYKQYEKDKNILIFAQNQLEAGETISLSADELRKALASCEEAHQLFNKLNTFREAVRKATESTAKEIKTAFGRSDAIRQMISARAERIKEPKAKLKYNDINNAEQAISEDKKKNHDFRVQLKALQTKNHENMDYMSECSKSLTDIQHLFSSLKDLSFIQNVLALKEAQIANPFDLRYAIRRKRQGKKEVSKIPWKAKMMIVDEFLERWAPSGGNDEET